MSYIRGSSVYRYVDGISEDYIFPTEYKKKIFIEDYGKISNETIIELLYRYFETEDKFGLKDYLLKKLAKRLRVKLRKNPLTVDQEIDITIKNHKKWVKENKKWLEELGFKDERKNN